MKASTSIVLRWIVAVLIFTDFSVAILKVVNENRAKGKPAVIEGYTAWSDEVLESASLIPVQDGIRADDRTMSSAGNTAARRLTTRFSICSRRIATAFSIIVSDDWETDVRS